MMRNRLFPRIFCLITVVMLIVCSVSVYAAQSDEPVSDTVNDALNIVDGILAWNLTKNHAASVQEWIDGDLTTNAGITSEWYILALAHDARYNFSAYRTALCAYLSEHETRSAAERLKYALVLHAVGNANPEQITEIMDASVGSMGIMSWIFGLHLLDNGYLCSAYSEDEMLDALLSLQHPDGGWSVNTQASDVDVTAMAIQALAPFQVKRESVSTAIDKALALLSSLQKDNGSFSSYGVENPESGAQVLIALSALGIDCKNDERFQKNGCTVIDGILRFRLAEGSFSHTLYGEANLTATVQVFDAMTAYVSMMENGDAFYHFSDNPPAETEQAPQSADSSASPGDGQTKNPIPIKGILILIDVGFGLLLLLILFLCGKRSKKNLYAIGILILVLAVIIGVTDFQSADSYYNGTGTEKEAICGTVTLTIRCDTVVGKSDSPYIPDDGVILDVTEFDIAEGDTVFSILNEAAQKYHIQMENAGQMDLVYISGIQYLYEFDFGDLSGWIYRVNGQTPSVGCADYVLSDGDCIEWLYTCNLGNDLE